MSRAPLLLALLAGCALPPRVDDRSTPEGAYATFRGALARGEHEREFGCLSDDLRTRIGIPSRARWAEARTVVLTQGHLVVRAISRSDVVGPAVAQADGRVLLPVRLRVFLGGRDGRVWVRPVPVVRVYVEGRAEPVFYRHLPAFALVRAGGVLGVRLTPDLLDDLAAELEGDRERWIEAGVEWFLDDFDVGEGSAASVRRELEEQP